MAEYTEEFIIDTTVKGADKAEKDLEGVADATNKAKKESEEYTETLGDMAKETEIFGVSINGMVGAFKNSVGAIKNSVTGLKAFKVALASTGIGLLVVALGSLVAWLQNTQQGLNFVNDTMAVLESVLGSVINLFTKLGSALKSLFEGDFKKAFNDASEAVKGFTDNVRDGVNATLELERATRKLQRANAENSVAIAENNEQIAKNKRVIEDVTGATDVRIQKAKENLELIQENARLEQESAQRAFDIEEKKIKDAEAESGRTTRLIADQEKLAELQVAIIETRIASEERQIEFANKLNELNALQQQEWLNAQNQQIMAVEAQQDLEIQNQGELTQLTKDELNARLKLTNEFYKNKAKQSQADYDLQKLYAQQEFQLGADLAGALAGLAGQDTILGKSLAIVQASMNTSVAITEAIKAPTMVQRVLGVAFATATGLKAVRDITSEPIPQVSINTSTPFGDGGMIHGDSHDAPSGGTWILAEGGEAVINKRSMRLPWVKKQVSYLNQIGGGVPIMERGGVVPDAPMVNPFINMERALASAQTVLVLDDLDRAQQGEFATRVVTTL